MGPNKLWTQPVPTHPPATLVAAPAHKAKLAEHGSENASTENESETTAEPAPEAPVAPSAAKEKNDEEGAFCKPHQVLLVNTEQGRESAPPEENETSPAVASAETAATDRDSEIETESANAKHKRIPRKNKKSKGEKVIFTLMLLR